MLDKDARSRPLLLSRHGMIFAMFAEEAWRMPTTRTMCRLQVIMCSLAKYGRCRGYECLIAIRISLTPSTYGVQLYRQCCDKWPWRGILGVDCPSASSLAQAETLDIIRLELQPHWRPCFHYAAGLSEKPTSMCLNDLSTVKT